MNDNFSLARELGTLDHRGINQKMKDKFKLLCLEYINSQKELDIFLIAITNIIR